MCCPFFKYFPKTSGFFDNVAQEIIATSVIFSSMVSIALIVNFSFFKRSQIAVAFSKLRPQINTSFIGRTAACALIKLIDSAPVPIINSEDASFLDK